MTDHAAIIAKIRKCLTLSKSANEHEAAAALAKAHALMAEHNITTEAVALADVSTARTKARATSRLPRWQNSLLGLIAGVFGVKPLLAPRTNEIIWIGVAPSAEIAAYAYQVIDRKISADRRRYCAEILKRCGTRSKIIRANAYCLGWVHGIHDKVEHLWSSHIPDVVGQYVSVHYSDTVKTTVTDSKKNRTTEKDLINGYCAGREHSLSHGVGSTATPQPQLEGW